MPEKTLPDKAIKEILIVEDPRVVKIIFSRKHNMILKLVTEKEMSITEIAKALEINPGSVHYHLKSLEKHGLVWQVREEIKGGVVKKYYRSVAKRILLDTPNFNKTLLDTTYSPTGAIDPLIGSIEYLGYHLPPENREDAGELLQRYDKRIKCLMAEINSSGLESMEDDGAIAQTASQMVFILRVKEDPEIARIYSEFHKLFMKYE